MVKPCEVCGDIGDTSAIITCSDCKSTREHLYCMRVVTMCPEPFWTCEECKERKLLSSKVTVNEDARETSTHKVSSLIQKSPRVTEVPNKNVIANRFNFKEKCVSTGKTQYLSCNEVVKMAWGADKLKGSLTKDFRSALGTSNSMPPPPQRIPVKSPQIQRGKKSESDLQKLGQQSTVSKENLLKSSKISRSNERTSTERESKIARIKVLSPFTEEADGGTIVEVVKSSVVYEKIDTKSGKKTGCKNVADVVGRSSDGGKRIQTNPLAVSETSYLPALNSNWKGTLNLPSGHEKFSGSFVAHPPSRVHIMVYETIVNMPESISFELVPYQEIYLEIFQGGLPDKDDIGLYFFPMFKKRSEYSTLIDFLWSRSLMMKSTVNGVELLVFTSKLLHPQSQELQGKYFLWGVFRSSKNSKKVAETRPVLEKKY